ncbi:MAG: DUF4331 domain-containing protein [Chloroflexi bacterium OHK40]
MRSARFFGRAVAAGLAMALTAGALGAATPAARASSHREAPLISRDPQADNTDLYAFRTPGAEHTVTIVANYIPLVEPNGGPNFTSFGDDVRYEIHIDNDGDADPNITYRLTFKTHIQNPDTFLYITGPVTSPTDPNFNLQQSYKVERIERSHGRYRSRTIGYGNVPPANVGPRSTPNYPAIAAQAITPLADGSTIFAGPRDDAFFVDLGAIFDLGGLRPFNQAHAIPLDPAQFGGAGIDGVSGYDTHTITIQVPIEQLTSDGQGADSTSAPVLGIYASASRQATRVLRSNGRVRSHGPWVQVSRLGNPLVNEVIIPLGLKDYWNAQEPRKDRQFQQYYESPELARIINALYGGALQPVDETGRTDLSAILLTGLDLPDGTKYTFTGSRPADLLRLNVGIAPTAPIGAGDRLGVLNGDLAGFPNGRRLEDDVTDIELRAVAQGYGPVLNSIFGLPDKSPNNLVGDGVDANDVPFLTAFPYQATANAGYDSTLHGGQRTPFGP